MPTTRHSRSLRNLAVTALTLVLALVALWLCPRPAEAAFPADGRFKMQPAAQDRWYYYDETHWYIKAPDKWQHLMGSYASTKILRAALGDDVSAATAVLIGGILKEADDAVREGWSTKDLLMDLLGVGAAVLDTPGVRLVSYYTNDRLIISLNFAISP